MISGRWIFRSNALDSRSSSSTQERNSMGEGTETSQGSKLIKIINWCTNVPSSLYEWKLHYRRLLRCCIRNKILRPANAKYHYCTFSFVKYIKKTYFWCIPAFLVWIHQFSHFLGCYWVIPFTPFIIQRKGCTEKQPVLWTLSTVEGSF